MSRSIFAALAICALALLVVTQPARAEPLPSVRFLCSFDADEMLARLKQEPLLVNLDKDQFGSPILLRVTHALVPTAAGTASSLASAVWAGGTLGLLPMVENKDLVITYDLYVNDTLLATYEYRNNFTRAISLFLKDKTQGLGDDGKAWALTTAAQFSADAAKDPKVSALIAEYHFYFGSAGVAVTR